MHPAMFFWHGRRRGACGDQGSCGPQGGERDERGPWHGGAPFGGGGGGGEEFGGGNFGVRRPLRFLSYKLDLDDGQVTELATILHELKTERAQSEVDHRRTTSALADSMSAATFDDAKAKSAASERVKSAERVQEAVTRGLGRIHALLRAEQRAKFAYLLRTGALSI